MDVKRVGGNKSSSNLFALNKAGTLGFGDSKQGHFRNKSKQFLINIRANPIQNNFSPIRGGKFSQKNLVSEVEILSDACMMEGHNEKGPKHFVPSHYLKKGAHSKRSFFNHPASRTTYHKTQTLLPTDQTGTPEGESQEVHWVPRNDSEPINHIHFLSKEYHSKPGMPMTQATSKRSTIGAATMSRNFNVNGTGSLYESSFSIRNLGDKKRLGVKMDTLKDMGRTIRRSHGTKSSTKNFYKIVEQKFEFLNTALNNYQELEDGEFLEGREPKDKRVLTELKKIFTSQLLKTFERHETKANIPGLNFTDNKGGPVKPPKKKKHNIIMNK